MGNKLETQENHQAQLDPWYISVERELSKLNDFLPRIHVRNDKMRKQHVAQFFNIQKPRSNSKQSNPESLFATEIDRRRHKKRLDIHCQFKVTQLVEECNSDDNEYAQLILNTLAKKEGCLQDIMDSFWSTKLHATTSQELDQFILRFIDAYVMILVYYYDLGRFAKEMDILFLNKKALKNLVTNMVFQDQLYNQVYELKKKEQLQINEQIHAQLLQSSEQSLEHYGISVKFCLNETTREYIMSKRSSKQKTIQSEVTDTSNVDYTPIIIESVEGDQLPERPHLRMLQPSIFQTSPYQEAIDALNTIQYRSQPHHKLKALYFCFQCISQAISDYYEQFSQEPSIVSTDELIIIFQYILSRAKLQNPYTHYDIMQRFCDSHEGVQGYYLTIMLSTLKLI